MQSRWRLALGVAISAIFMTVALSGLKLEDALVSLRQLKDAIAGLPQADYYWLLLGIAVYFLGVLTRSRWRLALGLAISAIVMTIALSGLKLEDAVASLRQANYYWLLPGIAVYFLGVWARTWRWHYMLRHLQDVPMKRLFRIVCIGYMGNNIYPARAGEVLRSYVLKREHGVRVSSSLATVIIERLFDGLTMLLFVFAALPFVDLHGALQDYRPFVVGFTFLFVAALFLFLFVASRPALAHALYNPVVHLLLPARYHDKVLGVAERFLDGLASLARGREVFMIFGTSVLVWLFETAKYWFVMHAFDFQVSFFTLMLMNGVVNLATTIPGAPGHVGTFDAPGIAILSAAGVPRATAAVYTLVLHAALWLPITLLGAFYLIRSHISLSQARQEMAEAETVGESEPDRTLRDV